MTQKKKKKTREKNNIEIYEIEYVNFVNLYILLLSFLHRYCSDF